MSNEIPILPSIFWYIICVVYNLGQNFENSLLQYELLDRYYLFNFYTIRENWLYDLTVVFKL